MAAAASDTGDMMMTIASCLSMTNEKKGTVMRGTNRGVAAKAEGVLASWPSETATLAEWGTMSHELIGSGNSNNNPSSIVIRWP